MKKLIGIVLILILCLSSCTDDKDGIRDTINVEAEELEPKYIIDVKDRSQHYYTNKIEFSYYENTVEFIADIDGKKRIIPVGNIYEIKKNREM